MYDIWELIIIMPLTNTIVIMNCESNNDLRRKTPLLPDLNDPFKTPAGLKLEMINAG